MSPIYTPGKVVLRKTWQPMDTDAAAYITAVETADGQALEERTKIAIDNFVLGCKADGIWSAIKASCILAGARTLAGALVPLVGTAPTNFNFVSGDYDRKTGLAGNKTNKYLNTNRASNADPRDSHHLSVFIKAESTGQRVFISAAANPDYSELLETGSLLTFRSRSATAGTLTPNGSGGFLGISRSNSSNIVFRGYRRSASALASSVTPLSTSYNVFRRSDNTLYCDDRLAFYSIGESLDLALLDARVTDLINAFGVAIP
jgi:hypothetical protein